MGIALTFSTSGCAKLRDSGCDEILSISTGGGASEQSRAQYFKGIRLYDHAKYPAATEAFERAISLDFENGSAHNNLGLTHFQQRKLSLAAAEFEIAAQLLPEDARPCNNLGMTLEAAGRGLEAIDFYQQAYEIEPQNPKYLGNLVRTRIRLGEKDESVIEQLKELLFIETRADWIAWINDQLAIDINPLLDRGPTPPNLNSQKKSELDRKKLPDLWKQDATQAVRQDRLLYGEVQNNLGDSILVGPAEPILELEQITPASKAPRR